MVEDNPDFVSDLSHHGISCFLLDEPRNQWYSYDSSSNVIRVKSRNEIDLSLLP
jgi:hypothetical protein